MKKQLLVGTALALTAPVALAQSFAFTSFNADEDGWAMVALSDIAASTTVYFQDNEYISGAFNTGESSFSWNTGAAMIAAGTVIRFSSIDTAARAASIGTFTAVDSTNFGISAGADTIYAFLGTSATNPTTFLTAVSNDLFVNGPLAGTGLTAGVNAIALTNSADFGQYIGPRNNQLTIAAYQPLVNNPSNWFIDVGGDGSAFVPNLTPFVPVPEPTTWALMLAGLGLAGAVARRRRA